MAPDEVVLTLVSGVREVLLRRGHREEVEVARAILAEQCRVLAGQDPRYGDACLRLARCAASLIADSPPVRDLDSAVTVLALPTAWLPPPVRDPQGGEL
jgi:hypothetical protein